jgi:hypothetical protein
VGKGVVPAHRGAGLGQEVTNLGMGRKETFPPSYPADSFLHLHLDRVPRCGGVLGLPLPFWKPLFQPGAGRGSQP